jgi:hypothetical protein
VRAAAAEFPDTLTPVLREAFVSSLSSPDVRAALDGATAEATRTALLSSRDVLAELHQEQEWQGLITRLQRLIVGSLVAAFLLGGFAFGLLVWGLHLRHLRRLSRQ